MNHLSYELCKQLKEAGFPQELDDLAPYYCKEAYRDVEVQYQNKLGISHGEEFQDSYYDIEDLDLFCYKIPTLSELIEACDTDGGALLMWGTGNKWYAGKQRPVTDLPDRVEDATWGDIHYTDGIEGKTPEEAVSKLWLALNKQKDK